MARTKNRYLENNIKEETATPKQSSITFKAGIYTRLSQDRKEENRDKSNSLLMQEELCIKVAKEKEIDVVKVYQDYEYSGTNFSRPAFKEMMEDIRAMKLNCIIVRDLSRFGREYLEIGNYIEKVFPFLGVRFISVNDSLDTADGIDHKKAFEIAIKNIINDVYAKDISKKVRACKETKMKQGYFIGAVAPYGYDVVKTGDGRKLVVDENVREVVELIFELAYKGMSQVDIARKLTLAYNTPLMYRRTKEVYRAKDNKTQWDASYIGHILSNEVYAGNLLQRTHRNKFGHDANGKYRDKKEWIRSENTHEALVDKEIFDEIAKIRNKKRGTLPYSSMKFIVNNNLEGSVIEKKLKYKNPDIHGKYDNILVCMICGRKPGKYFMRRKLKGGDEECYRYYCSGGNKLGFKTNHMTLYETDIDRIVLNTVRRILSQMQNEEELINKINTYYQDELISIDKKIQLLKIREKSLLFLVQQDYEAYVRGKISKTEFKEGKAGFRAKIDSNHLEQKELNIRKERLEKKKVELKEFIHGLYHFHHKTNIQIDRNLVHRIIQKIEIFEHRQLTIHFRFDIEKELEMISVGGGKTDE